MDPLRSYKERQVKIAFGEFVLDFASGELLRLGVKVGLQEQPMSVLRLLIERRGEMVSREELRNAIWPGNVVADSDDALNTVVRKIRAALGDSAESPRYLETLPRRGYRFKAIVEAGRRRSALCR